MKIKLRHADGLETEHDVSNDVVNAGVIINGERHYRYRSSSTFRTPLFEEVSVFEMKPSNSEELLSVPYDLYPLKRAYSSDDERIEYVTGYLTPPSDAVSHIWLGEQFDAIRKALPTGWSAAWLNTDSSDTRVVVSRRCTVAEKTWRQGFVHLTVDGEGLVSLWDKPRNESSYLKLELTTEQMATIEATMKKGGSTP